MNRNPSSVRRVTDTALSKHPITMTVPPAMGQESSTLSNTPTHDENLRMYDELREQWRNKMDTMIRGAKHALDRGYDFGRPHINLMTDIIYLEAELRAIHYQLYGTGVPTT